VSLEWKSAERTSAWLLCGRGCKSGHCERPSLTLQLRTPKEG
jgi:hypothetical protein